MVFPFTRLPRGNTLVSMESLEAVRPVTNASQRYRDTAIWRAIEEAAGVARSTREDCDALRTNVDRCGRGGARRQRPRRGADAAGADRVLAWAGPAARR